MKKPHNIICHTAWCRYNRVSLFPNPHNRYLIARPWGRAMGCILWVWNLTVFCHCHWSTECNIVINLTALQRHSTVYWVLIKKHDSIRIHYIWLSTIHRYKKNLSQKRQSSSHKQEESICLPLFINPKYTCMLCYRHYLCYFIELQ